VLAALPLAALSICTLAQNAAPAPDSRPSFFGHMLQKMDTNGDGRISLDEYLAAATTRFKRLDTQNKGSVDAAQMANSPAAAERIMHRAKSLVGRLDKAGNGYVTPDEFLAAATKRFARLDKNGDGKLTPDELGKHLDKPDANHDGAVTQNEYLAAATAMYRQFDAKGNGQVTASEIAASPKAQERAAHAVERIVKHLDGNADGVVSQDEYLAAARKRFTRLDKNGDGFIDADEMPAAHHFAHGAKPMASHG
jgi:Ca2+-binding EF-hand superfamily protein